MAGAGIGNVLGYVPLFDGANPRIFTGVARTNISGGVFVFASGAQGVVGSQAASFVATDISFAGDASGAQFNGIAIQSAGSNTLLAVATQGIVIVQVNGTVTAGQCVKCDGFNAAQDLGSTATALSLGPSMVIGRAVTNAASGEFCLVDIRA